MINDTVNGEYHTPTFRQLGSLSELTLGQGGSSLDGGARNNTQLGGGNTIQPGGNN